MWYCHAIFFDECAIFDVIFDNELIGKKKKNMVLSAFFYILAKFKKCTFYFQEGSDLFIFDDCRMFLYLH